MKDEIDEFIAGLEKMGKDVDEEAKKVLNIVSPIAIRNLQSNIEGAANRGYSTGDLAKSIIATTPRANDRGVFSAVRPTGVNRHGVRNGEVLGYLEHGVASHGQEAHPVLQKSASQSEKVLIEEMDKALERLSEF
jgi:HK97 gp10 family phage protein